jgi:hypothetical protein
MTRSVPPCCKTIVPWVKAQPRAGKACFAPCTGQDWAALKAFAHLVELYAYGDAQGRECAIQAMGAVVTAMQPHVRYLAKIMIPCMMDWSHEEEIWSQLVPIAPMRI